VTSLAFTPELSRNVRIQLRQRRMLAVAGICAAGSLSAVAYYNRGYAINAGDELLRSVVGLQVIVLLIGGGVYCLQSLHREKDLNTFDYQRITRLKPLELALGKLLGAPALAYFIVLCLMPLAFWAWLRSNADLSMLLLAYLVILLGSIAYQAVALLASLLLERGTSAGAILFFLVIAGFGSADYSQGSYGIHALSPFFALDLLPGAARPYTPAGVGPFALSPLMDSFFGVTVPHVLVLVIIYLTFTAWMLLALDRNIKRDPAAYEVFSPAQGFAFAMYLEFLLLGFSRWVVPQTVRVTGNQFATVYHPISPVTAEDAFLSVSLWIFVILGLALLRNRDRVRRRGRALGARAAGFWAALWPAPYLLVAVAASGIAIVAIIHFKLEPQSAWTPGLGLLEVAFFALWLARDALYLQWMSLRRTGRPLVSGLLYLAVFYVCAGAVMAGFGWYDVRHIPYRAVLIPSAAFELNSNTWASGSSAWIAALFLLFCQASVFAWLQRSALQSLLAPPPAIAPAFEK
jgi:hypothetical protein